MREKRPGVWEIHASAGFDAATGTYPKVWRTVHGTETEARRARNRLEVEVADGKARATVATFGQLLDEYLTWARPSLGETTWNEYERIARTTLKPALGKVKLRKLTRKHFEDLYHGLAVGRRPAVNGSPAPTRPLSASSIERVHATARRALNKAADWDWVDRNVVRGAERIPVRKPERVLPPVDDLARLMAYAFEQWPAMGALIVVAGLLGARRGEVCGLRWTEVHLDEDPPYVVVAFSEADLPGKGAVRKDTKTHQRRRIEIDPVVVGFLREWRRWCEREAAKSLQTIGDASYLFSREPDFSQPMRPGWATKAFGRARDATGVPEAQLKNLRHLNLSLMLRNAVPLEEVSGTAGHAQQTTTLTFYNEHVKGQPKQGPAVIARELGQVIPALNPSSDG